MRRSSVVVFLSLLGIFAAGVARAQEGADDAADERARMHFNAGSSYYSEGDYVSALREFQRAYELSPRPDFHYNFSLVYERQNDLANAVEHLRRYIEETPEERVQNRPTLEQRLANLERRLEEQRTREREEAERAERLRQLEERERAQGAAAEDEAGLPVLPIVAFGAGAAGLVGFAVFGGLVLSEDSELERGCLIREPACDEAATDRVATYALLADISLGVAIVGAGVGVALLLLGGEDEDAGEAATARVAPWLSPDGVGLITAGTL